MRASMALAFFLFASGTACASDKPTLVNLTTTSSAAASSAVREPRIAACYRHGRPCDGFDPRICCSGVCYQGRCTLTPRNEER
jgi:hypothetical protein